MLTGVYEKQIDLKGRLSIPKRFRDILASNDSPRFIMIKMDSCLQIYPSENFMRIQERLETLSPLKAKTRQLQRLWGQSAELVEIDSEGRIILSREQKQYADIDEKVIIIGAVNKIEIWGAGRWESVFAGSPRLEDVADEIESGP